LSNGVSALKESKVLNVVFQRRKNDEELLATVFHQWEENERLLIMVFQQQKGRGETSVGRSCFGNGEEMVDGGVLGVGRNEKC
jgi:hypothetical protein